MNRREVDGRRLVRRRDRRTENISGSRSINTGFEDCTWRLERAARSESGPPERRVEMVVSKSFPPTFSLMRSVRVILESPSSI